MSGTGAKALNFTDVYVKNGADLQAIGEFTLVTQASGNTYAPAAGNTQLLAVGIEVNAEDLDVDAGFDCVRARINDVGTTAQPRRPPVPGGPGAVRSAAVGDRELGDCTHSPPRAIARGGVSFGATGACVLGEQGKRGEGTTPRADGGQRRVVRVVRVHPEREGLLRPLCGFLCRGVRRSSGSPSGSREHGRPVRARELLVQHVPERRRHLRLEVTGSIEASSSML